MVSSGGRFFIQDSETHHSLVVSNTIPSDGGSWSCTLRSLQNQRTITQTTAVRYEGWYLLFAYCTYSPLTCVKQIVTKDTLRLPVHIEIMGLCSLPETTVECFRKFFMTHTHTYTHTDVHAHTYISRQNVITTK